MLSSSPFLASTPFYAIMKLIFAITGLFLLESSAVGDGDFVYY
jgi:hypothetical protein